ncbi:hypothetical protein FACS1894133_3350 [Clostridia bacterium]|nr:hypothetical protein FACS1894133_3350 [Clostridia bacterium]
MENTSLAQYETILYAESYNDFMNAAAEQRQTLIGGLIKKLAAAGITADETHIKQRINAVHKWHQLNSQGFANAEQLAQNGVDGETARICGLHAGNPAEFSRLKGAVTPLCTLPPKNDVPFSALPPKVSAGGGSGTTAVTGKKKLAFVIFAVLSVILIIVVVILNIGLNANKEISSHVKGGYNYYEKGDFDKAIEEYDKAIELKADYAEAYNGRGMSYDELGKYDKAIADYDKAIELDPDYSIAYNNRANTYINLEKYDKAKADCDKAIELKPDYAAAYCNRGIAYRKSGKYDKAIADYDKAIKLDPDYSIAYNNRANAYISLEKYDKAKADCDKAIELNPNISEAYNNRGYCYDEFGDYDKAIADYDKAIELDPDYSIAYNNRGYAYENLGNYDKAVADYKKAFELDSDNTKAANNLKRVEGKRDSSSGGEYGDDYSGYDDSYDGYRGQDGGELGGGNYGESAPDWVYYGGNVTVRQVADNPGTAPVNDYSGAYWFPSDGLKYYLDRNGNAFVTNGGKQYSLDSNGNLYINGVYNSTYDFDAPPAMSQTAVMNYMSEYRAIIIARYSGLDISTVQEILASLDYELRFPNG